MADDTPSETAWVDPTGKPTASTMMSIDDQELVSRADLVYTRQAARSEEGLPVGNGRMGTLVWTSPTALRLQINRVDVYATNNTTDSLYMQNSTYCGGCGYVDIGFVDYGEDVFPSQDTRQHLSVYEGTVTVEGRGIAARIWASQVHDVLVIEVSDRRPQPAVIHSNLRMLRLPVVRTKNHTATSRLEARDGRIVLTQAFTEGEYYCGSVVAVGVLGRDAQARIVNEMEVRLAAAPGPGSFTILVASAASFDPQEDVVEAALSQLNAAAAQGTDGLRRASEAWWQGFWARSFVSLHSADGVADAVEAKYTYYMYLMASTSRGILPPKFNGMLWITKGDRREWGSLYWWHNTRSYYNSALLAANRLELMDPMFDMFTGMYDACALAARQQWGSEGIFIPQTGWFDGLAGLPHDIAKEMQDLYLLRKPWEERSRRFRMYASSRNSFSSRWNWMARLPHNSYTESVRGLAGKDAEYPHYRSAWLTEEGWGFTDWACGPYGHTSHIFYSGAEIAYLYWLRYEYTLDRAWLCDRAYPMLKGVAEFYRNYPNVKKGQDGKYHIHHVNNHEETWGGQDTIKEITAMRGILPAAIVASQILDVDSDLRAAWQQFLEDLAPFPRNDHPDAVEPKGAGEQLLWINTLKPVRSYRGPGYSAFTPVAFCDLCTLETEDSERRAVGTATYLAHLHRQTANERYLGSEDRAQRNLPSRSKLSIAAAMLGRAGDVEMLIPAHFNHRNPMANRMILAEDVDAEYLGMASDALHRALCQSVPAEPGKESVIRVFPAWPQDWDASYTLLCRGGFLVTSSMQASRIHFVEIRSQLGGECRLRNPWPGREVTVYRDGKRWRDTSAGLLRFETTVEEVVVVVPKGESPKREQGSC